MERKIHLIRLNGHAGDVLLVRPVLRAFRKTVPHDRIYFETIFGYQGLMAGCQDVDFVRDIYHSRGQKTVIDVCDFQRRPWMGEHRHIMDVMGDACGVRVTDRSYGFRPTAQDDEWAGIEGDRWGKFAAIHQTTQRASKDWDPVRMGETVALLKSELGLRSVQVGGSGDHKIPGAVDLRGQLSFSRTAAVLARAEIFIGPDSLPMHLSRTVREVPAICLWGSTSAQTSGLFGDRVVNLEPQRGCDHDGNPCYDRCDFSSHCMAKIGPRDVLAAASRLLSTDPRPEITVVLLNWNSWSQYTHKTIRALEETMTSDWDMVLVDQGSKTDAPHLEKWTHPRLSGKTLFPENRGVPVAWNEAIRKARGRNILLLNTDIEILDKGWDRKALDVLEANPGAGILGISENEPPRNFGEAWKEVRLPIPSSGTTRCHHVNGSAFLVRRRTLDKVGPFDERFSPGYCEETDFCLRAGLMGEEVLHLVGPIRHEGHVVVARVNKMAIGPVVARNAEYFAKKWAGAKPPVIEPEPAPEKVGAA